MTFSSIRVPVNFVVRKGVFYLDSDNLSVKQYRVLQGKKNKKREECIVPASVKYLSILAANILTVVGRGEGTGEFCMSAQYKEAVFGKKCFVKC